ncbi:hypothetical protein [uncultured Thiothrix sp.]|uniref:hypothetical protein n=1 Tax=uncultured Thiothrix sp. TaxID=223185 RepID=UPI00261A1811|nr:hypothetical protein [uncultured Thiothrix sp.]HMT92247.1 hypothetical protein [Thiolinea sp.]
MESEVIVAIIGGLFGLAGIWLRAKLKVSERDTSMGESLGGSMAQSAVKSPKFAAAMSFFFPGVGELYLGQSKKGLTIFVLAIILGGGTMGVVWFILGVYSCFHAHKIGCLLARGLPIQAWE